MVRFGNGGRPVDAVKRDAGEEGSGGGVVGAIKRADHARQPRESATVFVTASDSCAGIDDVNGCRGPRTTTSPPALPCPVRPLRGYEPGRSGSDSRPARDITVT